MIKNDDCTIIVNSYDGGEDLWDGFFTCFEANWPDNPFKIVLNTETKSYKYKTLNITTYNFNHKLFNTWAYRFKNVLKKIDTEFVLVFLDDFWLDKKVDTNFINRMLDIMRNDKNISNISFRYVPYKNVDDKKYVELVKRVNDSPYIFNCQAGLWKTDKLIRYLRNHESAWDWELYGSYRGKRYKDSFYCIKDNYEEPFIYSEAGLIHRGKWIKEEAEHFANKYNINIDFFPRGVETIEYMHKKYSKSTLYEKIFKPHFWKRLFVVIRSKAHKLLSII